MSAHKILIFKKCLCLLSDVFCNAEVFTADLQGRVEDIDSQDLPHLAVSEASGVITLPATDVSGSFDQAAHTNGTTPIGGVRDAKSDASSAAAQEKPDTSSNAGEKSLGAWELLRFTLPTLGIWIINPVLRCARHNNTAGGRRQIAGHASTAGKHASDLCMPLLPWLQCVTLLLTDVTSDHDCFFAVWWTHQWWGLGRPGN